MRLKKFSGQTDRRSGGRRPPLSRSPWSRRPVLRGGLDRAPPVPSDLPAVPAAATRSAPRRPTFGACAAEAKLAPFTIERFEGVLAALEVAVGTDDLAPVTRGEPAEERREPGVGMQLVRRPRGTLLMWDCRKASHAASPILRRIGRHPPRTFPTVMLPTKTGRPPRQGGEGLEASRDIGGLPGNRPGRGMARSSKAVR